MSSRSIAIAGMRSEDTSYCVARSSSNRRLLWILVAATLAAQAGIQLICRQISLSLWTLLLQVLRDTASLKHVCPCDHLRARRDCASNRL